MQDNDPCRFCEFVSPSDEIVGEGEYFRLFFDEHPVSPGHLLVISKRHVSSVADLSPAEWAELQSLMAQGRQLIEGTNLRQLYLEKFGNLTKTRARPFFRQMLVHIGLDRPAEGYNYGINDGEVAGQTVPHFNLHIIPRYQGDKKDSRGGIRHVIPELGSY